MRHELFPVGELEPGKMRRVTVDGLAIVVVCKPDGRIRALRDLCPHRHASLASGRLEEIVVSDQVGGYARGEELILRCPWHGLEFDLETGRCVADPERLGARVYRVEVVDGSVVLDRP